MTPGKKKVFRWSRDLNHAVVLAGDGMKCQQMAWTVIGRELASRNEVERDDQVLAAVNSRVEMYIQWCSFIADYRKYISNVTPKRWWYSGDFGFYDSPKMSLTALNSQQMVHAVHSDIWDHVFPLRVSFGLNIVISVISILGEHPNISTHDCDQTCNHYFYSSCMVSLCSLDLAPLEVSWGLTTGDKKSDSELNEDRLRTWIVD